jgi:hypothetical protein
MAVMNVVAGALLSIVLTVNMCSATIVGTNPPNGACLCFNSDGVNVRSSACGTPFGTANAGSCYTYKGTKTTCSLSGVSYEFFNFDYSGTTGWSAGEYLDLSADTRCSSSGTGGFTDACMNCICQIESNCNENIGCLWDVTSYSCGPYQIKNAYYIDCGSPGSGWETCANNMACAETCVKAYMARYGTYCAGSNPVCEDYARIHNGGPLGCSSSATVGYWDKVRACCGCQTCCD